MNVEGYQFYTPLIQYYILQEDAQRNITLETKNMKNKQKHRKK